MANDEVFQINVREILRLKAPVLYKKIPDFVVSWFSKLVCQDQLNYYLRESAGLTGVSFMENTIRNFHIDLQLHGMENLPDPNRRCIFVSNHPLGGLDGICLSAVLGKKYNERIHYLVNDILCFIEPLRDIFVPINKHGAQAKSAVNRLNETFSSENQIITFPAGLCSRKNKGIVHDLQWKKMFIAKAVEYQRDVVPIYFDARNSNFFYAIANIRKKLSLKFNIEMLFLPREMLKQRCATLNIFFGKPVAWQTFDLSKTPQEWAEEIERQVYNMI